MIAVWVAFVVLTQLVTGSLGGATYRDTFSLPGTETDKVVHLLDKAGQSDQNGPYRSGRAARQVRHAADPARRRSRQRSPVCCAGDRRVVNVATPWKAVTCADGRP